MPDKGHMETEALLRALEKRIAAEYRKANREITRKVNAYMSEFKRKDKEWREKLENGDITEAEYKAWATGQVMIGKRWEEMRHTLAQDYANTNDLAKQMAYDSMPDVYALNHNYATFEVEKGGKVDTSYTLYDRPTVERLIRDDPKLLPDPRPGSPLAQKLAKNKELRWEEQHVQSVVLQSILQGESLEQTAKRFTQLTEMNYRQSVRYARTATTGAQNAGRVDGYKRAEKLGVDMKQTWLATLDSRTRHEHRVLDGQEVDVGEPFIMDGFKIKYPGDPAAPAHLLFNCRCTVIAKVNGVDFNVSDKTQRDDKLGDMSYEEWKGEHKTAPKPPENVSEGKAVEVKVDKPAKGEYKEEKVPEKPKKAVFVPAKTEFTPAKNLQEAEQFISQYVDKNQFGAIGVDYKGIDVDAANQINERLSMLWETFNVGKFGGIAAPAKNTKLGKMLDEGDAVAGYMSIRNSFVLNRTNLKSVKIAEKSFADENKSIKDLLEHPEKYDFSKMSRTARKIIENAKISGRGTVPDNIAEAITHEFGHSLEKQIKKHELWAQVEKDMETYAPKISGYATTEKGEYIAESFASWVKGEDYADPNLIAIFESLKRGV